MMRVLWVVVLMVVAGAAQAWPWTTPESCVSEHATKAQGKASLGYIHTACRWHYGEGQTPIDAHKGECFIDRIDEPESEVAFRVLLAQCHDDAVAIYPRDSLDEYQNEFVARLNLPKACKWEVDPPSLFVSDGEWNEAVKAQADRCQERAAG